MNTTTIAGIIAAVVLVGAGAYVLMNPSTPSDQVAAVAEGQNESASVGSTFAELVASGQPAECSFSYDDGAGNSSAGILYIANGSEIRGDFSITSPEMAEMHMIRTGGYMYVWGSAMPQGMKKAVTAENESSLFETQTAGIDPNTKYKCVSWSVDAAKFAVPTDVDFLDVDALMGS